LEKFSGERQKSAFLKFPHGHSSKTKICSGAEYPVQQFICEYPKNRTPKPELAMLRNTENIASWNPDPINL
jgi:hypothetical protein